jgi:hypothetical protein
VRVEITRAAQAALSPEIPARTSARGSADQSATNIAMKVSRLIAKHGGDADGGGDRHQ